MGNAAVSGLEASTCCTSRSDDTDERPVIGPTAPLLVLHFNINKTMVITDVTQHKTAEQVLGEVLAHSAWGHIEEGIFYNDWQWDEKELSSSPPSGLSLSYADWLEKSDHDENSRQKQMHELGLDGNSKASLQLAQAREDLQDVLRPSQGLEGYKAMFNPSRKMLAEQEFRYIVPAFFHCLIALANQGRRFVVVFRTFGHDIDRGLLDEFNAFAEGKHPLYPNVGRFDGTNGRPDLRLSLKDPESHGSFYRDEDGDHLVLGILDQPRSLSVGLSYYEGGENIKIVSGHPVISTYLSKVYAQRGAFALRDHEPFWSAKNHASDAGKLLYVELADTSIHPIFFDDGVGGKELRIVDARDVGGEPVSFEAVSGVYVVKSEPYDCLQDENYFLNCIKAAEEKRVSAN